MPSPSCYTRSMHTDRQAALTPEQLAALAEGDGYVSVQDPQTGHFYVLIEQHKPTLDDDYIREKLKESRASIDAGKGVPWNLDEVKAEVRKRRTER
jgi:hypothetical protein